MNRYCKISKGPIEGIGIWYIELENPGHFKTNLIENKNKRKGGSKEKGYLAIHLRVGRTAVEVQ